MEESNFWRVIEKSWENSGKNDERLNAIKTNDEELLEELMEFIEDELLSFYQLELKKLNKQDLKSFIAILEEKLYDIDRKEIHEYTDGSDDGFLYCRCFILSMGEEYYNMIDKDPTKAKFDLEAEMFGFEAYSIYENVYNEEFERYKNHSIESCSNSEGWKE